LRVEEEEEDDLGCRPLGEFDEDTSEFNLQRMA